ncbi:hypothetical protein SOVF_018880 [Spinacia oleracea]|nr:hypothetical protein SOVF_018880 [Spinacia oleracea]
MEEIEEIDPGDEECWQMVEFEDYSKSDVSNGKLSWIWRNGVNLGKKMVVTGVVVSSASFFLPPLVALSAIGFAFSVPAGFVIISYACGEKLLDTLLPMPLPTPYEEYEPMYSDELVEYVVDRVEIDEGYEEEEKEFEEDTRKGIEMRIDVSEEINKENSDHVQGRRLSEMSEIVEEGVYEEDDVGECMEDEDQHLDSKIIPDILEGIEEAENEISLMKKEDGGIPRDSLSAFSVEAQESGENENNVEQAREDLAFVGGENENNVEVRYEEDVGEQIVPDILEEIKGAENDVSLMEKEEVVVPLREVVVESQVGGEDENNVEQITEDSSFLGGEYANNVEVVTEEDMVFVGEEDENNVEQVAGYEEDDEEQPQKTEVLPDVLEGIVETENQFPLVDGENVNNVEQVAGYEEDVEEQPQKTEILPDVLEGIVETENQFPLVEGKNVNNVEQVTEEIAFVPTRDGTEEDEYRGNVAGLDEEKLRSETTGLIEKMRDEGINDQKKTKESPAKVTPEENEIGDKNLIVIPEETEPAIDDKGVINSFESDANSEYLSFEEDESGLMHEEPKSAVQNQLMVNVKIDGDHTVTDIHQGSSADKLGTLLLPKGRETADVSGTVEPDQVADSFDKKSEGDDLSLNNEAEVSVEYREVLIVSSLSVSESASDQGTISSSDKVKPDEEKIWEQINAMRTIVGYKNTPNPSCEEELKALYAFTGVEPPAASCKGPVDLADINEKLHFFMSIVGVK